MSEITITCPNPNNVAILGDGSPLWQVWPNLTPAERKQIDTLMRTRQIGTSITVDYEDPIPPFYFYLPGSPCYDKMEAAGFKRGFMLPEDDQQYTTGQHNTPLVPASVPWHSFLDWSEFLNALGKYKWWLLAGAVALLVVSSNRK